MNNSDLAQAFADQAGMSKASAKMMVDQIFAAIGDAAARGEEVSIPGFGKFKVKQTVARQGRNPQTGDPINIPAAKKLAFSPALALRTRLNG